MESPLSEWAALVGAFLASAFALVRYSQQQHRAMVDRFVNFLEASLKRQETVNERFQAALEELGQTVRRSSLLLDRLAKRLNVPSDDRRDG